MGHALVAREALGAPGRSNKLGRPDPRDNRFVEEIAIRRVTKDTPDLMIPQIQNADAWQMLVDDDRAVLIDVRTETEWRSIGVPDTSTTGRDARFVVWTDEHGRPNPHFIDQATDGLHPDTPILLLCRSGVRSNAAAELLTASGYTNAMNVIAGFEGPVGADGRHAGGWKDSLPHTNYRDG